MHNADVIHKDYHSGNIFIGYFVMTGDLGISKSAMDDDDGEIYGVIPYVAPEIFQGQKYTKASDIYSFGMIMWELMTGRRPFCITKFQGVQYCTLLCNDFNIVQYIVKNLNCSKFMQKLAKVFAI